jgi:CheY-like chemotaxis protein
MKPEPEKTPTFADLEHDVRNIAAAMQSAVDVIRSDVNLPSGSKDMIAILDRQLEYLLKSVSEFCKQPVPCHAPLDRMASSIPPPEENQSQLRSLDVMIVDDTRLVTHTLQKLLETMGQHARTASSGASAMEAILDKLPDLVLSDIGMLGMDGYELARQIRSVPHGNDVYLVALTGHSSLESKRQAIDAGFDECHEKPIASATLWTILRTTNGRRQVSRIG